MHEGQIGDEISCIKILENKTVILIIFCFLCFHAIIWPFCLVNQCLSSEAVGARNYVRSSHAQSKSTVRAGVHYVPEVPGQISSTHAWFGQHYAHYTTSASVAEARPASVAEARPASVAEARPTSVAEARPASKTFKTLLSIAMWSWLSGWYTKCCSNK